jgi:hypothetical protein
MVCGDLAPWQEILLHREVDHGNMFLLNIAKGGNMGLQNTYYPRDKRWGEDIFVNDVLRTIEMHNALLLSRDFWE